MLSALGREIDHQAVSQHILLRLTDPATGRVVTRERMLRVEPARAGN